MRSKGDAEPCALSQTILSPPSDALTVTERGREIAELLLRGLQESVLTDKILVISTLNRQSDCLEAKSGEFMTDNLDLPLRIGTQGWKLFLSSSIQSCAPRRDKVLYPPKTRWRSAAKLNQFARCVAFILSIL